MKKTIFALAILLFLAACKYEDGPLISLRSKEKRLTGTWKIENLTIDGIDSTALYKDSCDCNLFFFIDYNKHKGVQFLYPINNQWAGYWSFENNKGYLFIHMYSDTFWLPPFHSKAIGPIGPSTESHWEILKLTNNRFWFTTKYNGKEYNFKFKILYKKY